MVSILKHLSDYAVKFFWEIWVIIPIIIVIYGLLSVYKYGLNFSIFSSNSDITKSAELNKTNSNSSLVLGFFIVFLISYIYLILYNEDFAYYDESQYLLTTLRGRNFPAPIWISQGRFWPLGHQEFNLIRLLTQAPVGYHIFPILQLLIVVATLFIFLIDFPVGFRISLITIITITPSFVISFFGLVYPERNIIFWLIILLACFQYFIKTRCIIYFCATLIAAQFALYYKEPIFLLIGGFAGTRLLLQFFGERSLLQRRGYYQFFKTHCLEVGLLILTGIYLLLYLSIFLPYMNFEYARSISTDIFSILVSYLKLDLLLDIFIVTMISRLIYLIYSRQLPNSFWDSLAVGTFLYFLSYIKLQIFNSYYMAPVDFIAILYLGQLVYPWFKKKKVAYSLITTLVIFLILGRNTAYCFYNIAARKNFINGKTQLTQFISEYTKKGNGRHRILFFPYSTGYDIMEVSAFLEYKGLKLAKHDPPKSTDKLILTVKSPEQFPVENRCIDYECSLKCFQAKYPQSGDLIIVLPNDKISTKELIKLKQESTLLFHYQPRPPFVKKILPLFFFDSRPDTWFHIYVFQRP
jgi:hypothetical protein